MFWSGIYINWDHLRTIYSLVFWRKSKFGKITPAEKIISHISNSLENNLALPQWVCEEHGWTDNALIFPKHCFIFSEFESAHTLSISLHCNFLQIHSSLERLKKKNHKPTLPHLKNPQTPGKYSEEENTLVIFAILLKFLKWLYFKYLS